MKRIARESYTIVKESGVVKALRSTYRQGRSYVGAWGQGRFWGKPSKPRGWATPLPRATKKKKKNKKKLVYMKKKKNLVYIIFFLTSIHNKNKKEKLRGQHNNQQIKGMKKKKKQ
jgi:hypothetical protein